MLFFALRFGVYLEEDHVFVPCIARMREGVGGADCAYM